MKLFQLSVILLLVIAGSCQKDAPAISESHAILKWRGDYEVDGCGFFVVIGKEEYKPENESAISDDFKTDSETEVIVHYEKTGKKIQSYCEWGKPKINDGIKIISIRKK